MRQKAEQAIRRAALSLGKSDCYRLDKVRHRAGLHRKVFDKTILDMARLETIRLNSGNGPELDNVEIGDLVRKGDAIYISFSFAESEKAQAKSEPDADYVIKPVQAKPKPKPEADPAVNLEPQTTDAMLQGIDRAEWEMFEFLCEAREGKKAFQKIQNMIMEYNRQDGESVSGREISIPADFEPDMKELGKLIASMERIIDIGQNFARESMATDPEQRLQITYWRYVKQDLKDIRRLLSAFL